MSAVDNIVILHGKYLYCNFGNTNLVIDPFCGVTHSNSVIPPTHPLPA